MSKYIITQGDEIVGNAFTIQTALEIFEKVPPPKRPSQARAIYFLVIED